MKIALFALFVASLAVAAEPSGKITPTDSGDLIPKAIPKHVRYSKPTIEHARKARAALVKEFTREERTDLRSSPIIVCHKTWSRIDHLKLIDPEKGTKFTGITPDGTKVQGRGYRDEPEIKITWKFLRECLHSNTETKVRTPTEQEISIYWSQIAWDIEDSPLFVVEHGDQRALFVFAKEKVFQVIDLSNPKLKSEQGEQNAAEQPAAAPRSKSK